jgi:hypothetical protein
MARPPKKLAQSLEALHKLQTEDGAAAIRAKDLPRTHRERLLRNGFLQGGHKGLVYPEPARRRERREHGVVCLVLAVLRCLSGRAFWHGMVPVAGAVFIASRGKLDSAPPAHGALAWSPE